MHDGQTCEEYDKRKAWEQLPSAEKEQASREEIKKNTKKCPGPGCPFNIYKTDGCDHMRCKAFIFGARSCFNTDENL